MKLRSTIICLLASVLFLFTVVPAKATPIWDSDASGELTGNRSSSTASGVDATFDWDNGGFIIKWDIVEVDTGLWKYTYTVTGETKGLSHLILEVTEDDDPFTTYGGTLPYEGPDNWSESSSNPLMPNTIHGVKFDFGDTKVTYSMTTDRAPVYGVFYTKDGVDDATKEDVVAWSSALNESDYKTNVGLTSTDFIVRPDSYTGYIPPLNIPEPATMLLIGSGLLVIAASGKKKFKRKNGQFVQA